MTDLVMLGAQPLTRKNIIELVRRHAIGGAHEVRIDVTIDHDDGPAIEVATVELNSAPDGNWWLQYVSHPAQSGGLTEAIAPCKSDFVAFLQVRKAMRLPQTLTLVCAQDLDDEGLGPLAALNLRPFNRAPIVPTKADRDQLLGLTNMC